MSLPDALRCPDVEAELLGAALTGQAEGAATLLRHVTPADFAEPEFRTLARVLQHLVQAGADPDPTLIAEGYARLGLGDLPADLFDRVLAGIAGLAMIPHYAAIVRDRSARRTAYLALDAGAQRAANLQVPLSETTAAAATALVFAPDADAQPGITQLVHAALEEIEQEQRHGTIPGIPTGLRRVDELTRGWQPGHLIIVAARPSVGKTRFASFCAREALAAERPVLFVTAEMSAKQITRRLLGLEARVDLTDIRDRDWTKLARAAGVVARWPVEVDFRCTTPGMVRLAADRMRRKYGALGLVIVDYIQLFRGEGRPENRNLEVGSVGRELHRVALDLDVPVLALSQLSRAVEKNKEPRKPVLSDLRDSGELEQAADLVAFLHADESNDDVVRDVRRVEFLLAKNRHGKKGKADLESHPDGYWNQVSWEKRVVA